MSKKTTKPRKSNLKPFCPEGGALRNFLNMVMGIVADEAHCLEHANMAKSEGDLERYRYFKRQANHGRALRLKMINSVAWSTDTQCRLKHRLDSMANHIETIMRAISQKQETSVLFECYDQAVYTIQEIVDKMYADYSP